MCRSCGRDRHCKRAKYRGAAWQVRPYRRRHPANGEDTVFGGQEVEIAGGDLGIAEADDELCGGTAEAEFGQACIQHQRVEAAIALPACLSSPVWTMKMSLPCLRSGYESAIRIADGGNDRDQGVAIEIGEFLADRAAGQDIVAAKPFDPVVAGAADEDIIAEIALDQVIADAADIVDQRALGSP